MVPCGGVEPSAPQLHNVFFFEFSFASHRGWFFVGGGGIVSCTIGKCGTLGTPTAGGRRNEYRGGVRHTWIAGAHFTQAWPIGTVLHLLLGVI